MRQKLLKVGLVAPILVALTSATGCASELQNQLCHRGWTVGHPTMTTEGVSIGPDAHVRARSEGAKGNFGAGYVTAIDLY